MDMTSLSGCGFWSGWIGGSGDGVTGGYLWGGGLPLQNQSLKAYRSIGFLYINSQSIFWMVLEGDFSHLFGQERLKITNIIWKVGNYYRLQSVMVGGDWEISRLSTKFYVWKDYGGLYLLITYGARYSISNIWNSLWFLIRSYRDPRNLIIHPSFGGGSWRFCHGFSRDWFDILGMVLWCELV